ncbi:MAG: undecaprenyl-diphosphate phosphatase, partial [Bacteroidales bacterium]|nr:undecaprenyl-diphosphate phosphatase [Bacteroidales bacterium]
MIPIGIVGVFFKDWVEEVFGNDQVVGICLLVTAVLLAFTYYVRPREKKDISVKDAFIIGLAQAAAVLPGLSRSGSTIATGLLLGNSRQNMAQFSFLMVIPPILGEAILDLRHLVAPSEEYLMTHPVEEAIPFSVLAVGFIAAFISGCLACKWMIALVKKCKLIYFAIYCAIVGTLALIFF